MTSWPGFEYSKKNVSFEEIQQSVLYGFELCFGSGCSEQVIMWSKKPKKLLYLLGPRTRFLLILLAILVFIIAGVSLPVTIIIGIIGLLVLFIFTSSWVGIQNYFYHQGFLSANYIVFIVCFTGALNTLVIIIIGSGVVLLILYNIIHTVVGNRYMAPLATQFVFSGVLIRT
ncbi:uncharacterized protein LOC121780292 [Salvia splendens]|uniref:uncharacterized protein LOC121780292 n=1 Tax=Salvia splendens TaxID=180675 RepID=UPI001C27949E|nr:uncharacterized protein LOC121780292 [Salvia splendens]